MFLLSCVVLIYFLFFAGKMLKKPVIRFDTVIRFFDTVYLDMLPILLVSPAFGLVYLTRFYCYM